MPFTPEQFFDVFERYNLAVWPAQVVLYAVAAAIIALIGRPARVSSKVVALFLALLWIWMGAVYHLGFFRSVNPAAVAFAVLCFVAAAVFLWQGVARDDLCFMWPPGTRRWLAVAVLAYALLIYPAIGLAVGHGYWRSPTFGAPCPTTIFTFGVLLLARRIPVAAIVVPVAWAAIAMQAAIGLNVPQDFGLPFAAALVLWAALRDRRRLAPGSG